jgi:hypothetical protein
MGLSSGGERDVTAAFPATRLNGRSMVHHRRTKIHGFNGGKAARLPVAKARTPTIAENRGHLSRGGPAICEPFAGGGA